MTSASAAGARRYPIRVDPMFRGLFAALGAGARHDVVELDGGRLRVRLGWLFRADVAVSAVTTAQLHADMYGGWGAHGFGGRWLVNGSSKGIVQLDFAPRQPARLLGVWPLRLRTLYVSLEDPGGFLDALGRPAAATS